MSPRSDLKRVTVGPSPGHPGLGAPRRPPRPSCCDARKGCSADPEVCGVPAPSHHSHAPAPPLGLGRPWGATQLRPGGDPIHEQ